MHVRRASLWVLVLVFGTALRASAQVKVPAAADASGKAGRVEALNGLFKKGAMPDPSEFPKGQMTAYSGRCFEAGKEASSDALLAGYYVAEKAEDPAIGGPLFPPKAVPEPKLKLELYVGIGEAEGQYDKPSPEQERFFEDWTLKHPNPDARAQDGSLIAALQRSREFGVDESGLLRLRKSGAYWVGRLTRPFSGSDGEYQMCYFYNKVIPAAN